MTRPVGERIDECGCSYDLHDAGGEVVATVAVVCDGCRLRGRVEELEAEVAMLRADNDALTDRLADLALRFAQRSVSEGHRRIAAERHRQVQVEGYSPEHDDEHSIVELWDAACAYTYCDPRAWPWEPGGFKLGPTRVRELEKAGALFLALAEFAQRRADAAAESIGALLGSGERGVEQHTACVPADKVIVHADIDGRLHVSTLVRERNEARGRVAELEAGITNLADEYSYHDSMPVLVSYQLRALLGSGEGDQT